MFTLNDELGVLFKGMSRDSNGNLRQTAPRSAGYEAGPQSQSDVAKRTERYAQRLSGMAVKAKESGYEVEGRILQNQAEYELAALAAEMASRSSDRASDDVARNRADEHRDAANSEMARLQSEARELDKSYMVKLSHERGRNEQEAPRNDQQSEQRHELAEQQAKIKREFGNNFREERAGEKLRADLRAGLKPELQSSYDHYRGRVATMVAEKKGVDPKGYQLTKDEAVRFDRAFASNSADAKRSHEVTRLEQRCEEGLARRDPAAPRPEIQRHDQKKLGDEEKRAIEGRTGKPVPRDVDGHKAEPDRDRTQVKYIRERDQAHTMTDLGKTVRVEKEHKYDLDTIKSGLSLADSKFNTIGVRSQDDKFKALTAQAAVEMGLDSKFKSKDMAPFLEAARKEREVAQQKHDEQKRQQGEVKAKDKVNTQEREPQKEKQAGQELAGERLRQKAPEPAKDSNRELPKEQDQAKAKEPVKAVELQKDRTQEPARAPTLGPMPLSPAKQESAKAEQEPTKDLSQQASAQQAKTPEPAVSNRPWAAAASAARSRESVEPGPVAEKANERVAARSQEAQQENPAAAPAEEVPRGTASQPDKSDDQAHTPERSEGQEPASEVAEKAPEQQSTQQQESGKTARPWAAQASAARERESDIAAAQPRAKSEDEELSR